MSAPFRLLQRDELRAPMKMEPAVVLRTSLSALAISLGQSLELPPAAIFHARDSYALYVEVAGIQLGFVEFSEQPHEIHVYAGDHDVGQDAGGFLGLLESLPIDGVHGDWWVRHDQPGWPGNGASTFVINGRRQ
jgi:hypothetical protein